MLKFALLALIAVVAGVAATGVVEQHDAAIAEVAAAMPEHAEAFAEVAAAAGTKDVFAVLDAISANIESERKHAQVFYRSYKKTTARDLRRYKLLIAKLSAGERRGKQATKGERVEARQLRRAVNANVRKLSRAVARFQHVQGEERRTTHKKKAALRHINNKIADRKTYLRVLKAIGAALRNTNQPVAARFLEALSVAHSNGMGSHADAPTVFLQMDAAEAEAVDESADNTDEAEVDAAIDHEAFAMENMPSEHELELVDEAEVEAEVEAEDEAMTEAEEDAEDAAEESAEDQDEAELEAESQDEAEAVEENAAESALDAAEEAEEEEADEAEQQEESEAESEAEAEAESDSEAEDSGSDARMMQVLEALATGARDDASVQELLTLVDALVADVREGIAAAKKRRVAVLAKYADQMKNLQALANSIKDSIRRLQVVVQQGRARLAELEGAATAVQANSKEANAQLTAYRGIAKGIKKNWKKYEARYKKNQKRRDKQLEQLAELKRRLAAIERERGTLGIDLSAINLRYRWKAYPFGACQAACGPSKRARKVKCLSFSGKPVKHSFCAGQKKPKREVKCQKKACPIACVASEWKARGKCSNQCGTGVRLHTRQVIEPARFGGRCPQQFKLTKHKACRSVKACAPGAEPTKQSRSEGKAAIAAARKARQDAKIAAAQAQAAKRAEALLGVNPNAAKAAAPLTPKQQAKRAKNKRCRACAKGKKGGPCRFQNCLNKAQKLACKACRKGKAGRACRLRKCKQPAMTRRRALKKRAAKRKAAKRAAAKAAKKAAAAGQAPQQSQSQQPLTKLQKKIRSLKAKIAARRAHCARCRKLKRDGKKKKAKRCRKNRKCAAVKRWEAELKRARKARAEEKARLAAGKAPLTKAQKRIRALKARIAKLKAKCQKCRDLKKQKKLKKAKRCRKNRKCKRVAKRIAKLEKELAAARAARAAEKAGAGKAAAKGKGKGKGKAAKKSAKKYKACRAKCASGKKGKRCRSKCRNARLRRAAARARREHKAREERRKRRAARRAAEKKRREALAKAKADAAAAAAAAAPATPAAAAPAPADDSMSPEVVIAKFRQEHSF